MLDDSMDLGPYDQDEDEPDVGRLSLFAVGRDVEEGLRRWAVDMLAAFTYVVTFPEGTVTVVLSWTDAE